jgi:hypothetical protein
MNITKKAKGYIFAAIFTATTTAFAATTNTVVYTAAQTSLADGKISFVYDGEAITQIKLNPAADEVLVMTGDNLVFASEAKILAGGSGESRIENAFSGATTLTIEPDVSTVETITYGEVENNSYKLPYETAASDEWKTMFEDKNLNELFIISSEEPAYHRDDPNLIQKPYNVSCVGDSMLAELQVVDRYWSKNFIRSILLELRQDGDDVKGRLKDYGLYLYTQDYENLLGKSFYGDNPDITGTKYGNDYGERNSSNAYMARQIVMGIRPKVTFAVNGTQALPVMAGGNVIVTFDANTTAVETTLTYGAVGNDTYKLPYETQDEMTWKTLFSGTSLDELSFVSSEDSKGLIQLPYHVVRSGDTMQAELQAVSVYKNDPYVRSVWIELWQDGNDVKGRIKHWGRYIYASQIKEYTGDINDYLGKRFYGEAPEVSYSERTSSNAYQARQLTMKKTVKQAIVTAANANSMVNTDYILRAENGNKMTFQHNNIAAFPNGKVDAFGKVTVTQNGAIGAYNNGTAKITIHSGSVLDVAQLECLAGGYEATPLVIDGGTLKRSNGRVHPQWLTLQNGGKIEDAGGKYFFRTLYYNTGAKWLITGDGVSIAEFKSDFSLYYNNCLHELPIVVEDTVPGEGVDFEWNGNIDSAAAGSFAHDVCIAKSGPGTMRLNGQIKYTYRPTRISAGTLLLGQTDTVVAGASFLMDGGTLSLADGTANTCKSIEVLADSTIDFGSDATLTIDTLTVAEGATLTLTGDAAKKLKVNVSLDGAGVVMLNGKRISRMADGYLGTLGLIITLM